MSEDRNHNRLARWIFGVFALLLIAAAIFGVSQYRDIPVKVSAETTIYTSPLKASGVVDYLKAFEEEHYSDQIATEENGFRLIVANVDFAEAISAEQLAVVCEKLSLDASSIKRDLRYIDPYEHCNQYIKTDQYDVEFVRQLDYLGNVTGRKEGEAFEPYDHWEVSEVIVGRSVMPWTEKDLPMMESWVTDNSAVLDLYAQAVRKPSFEVPFCRIDENEMMIGTLAPYVQEFRSIARGYHTRANYYLGKGQVRKAIDDIVACKRLGRHIRNQNTLVDRLVGIAIEGISDFIGVVDVKGKPTSKADLEYLIKELGSLPKLSELDKFFFYEKLSMIEILHQLANTDDTQSLDYLERIEKLYSIGLDWNIVLTKFGPLYDQYCQGADPEEEKFQVTFSDFMSRKARSEKFARWYASFMAPASYAVLEAENRTRCSDNLRRITLAMLLYEKDHGTLPPAFSADEEGKPLHSWRVLLLPYLGEQELYDSLRLDEPWNSSHNAAFADQCPAVFACSSCSHCEKGQTSYSVILGADLPFQGSVGKQLSSFGSHSNDMILVGERTQPVAWLDPTVEIIQEEAELGINEEYRDFGKDKRATAVGSLHPAGTQFGLRNGATTFVSQTITIELLSKLLRGTNEKFVSW